MPPNVFSFTEKEQIHEKKSCTRALKRKCEKNRDFTELQIRKTLVIS